MATMALSKQSRKQVYDEIRNAWVVATPEEVVRQTLLKKMIYKLSYPRELIVVEKALSEIPCFAGLSGLIPMRRIDVACFAKGIRLDAGLAPLLIVECKGSEKEVEKAFQQVKGYNHYLQAYFIAVAYPEGEVFGFIENGAFRVLNYLPSYSNLMQYVH